MQIQNYFVAIVQLVFCMSHDAGVGENGRKKENRPCLAPVLYTVGHIWEHELYLYQGRNENFFNLAKVSYFYVLGTSSDDLLIWRNFEFWSTNISYCLL